ncbi:MAG: calcium-transporting P-type ATPase, PMR1-type [Limnochordia bacterium]
MQTRPWFTMEVGEVERRLKTSLKTGLTEKEAQRRLRHYGDNKLESGGRRSLLASFVLQFKDFMVLVLLGATGISYLLGETLDAIAIIMIVILNAVLGFTQEYRAERSLEALKTLSPPSATIIRGGKFLQLPAAALVPGDLVLLETGNRVPADMRLVETLNLEINEAALTGESVPVEKRSSWIGETDCTLGDRCNMAFMGTTVTKGRGRGLVVATGMETEIGQIAGMIRETEEDLTPLQKRLKGLGRWLIALCLVIVAAVVGTGVVRGYSIYQMFMIGVTLAVAAIPEGLPAVVTIALAVGVQRMSRRRAIIRRLPAVETLGCTTVICSDKTGTLTQNEMTVTHLWFAHGTLTVTGHGYRPEGQISLKGRSVSPEQDRVLQLSLEVCLLCNNSHIQSTRNDTWEVIGDPTEGALLSLAMKGGLDRTKLEREHPVLAEIPFDSYRKLMTVIVGDNHSRRALTKGALEMVLPRCAHILTGQGFRPLTSAERERILRANDHLTDQGLRVLALAYRDVQPGTSPRQVEEKMVFLGLVGMIDPPRPEAKEALQVANRAGIRTVMITGDHYRTAAAVGKELGLLEGEGEILTGVDLDRMTDRELSQLVERITVYARVTPQHKLRIVRALKAKGHVVAMTGDGINDAPAVKEADIGIAMGKTGTDVTKEASSMILVDDNYATIVAAVEEGREIYENIRKFIRYLLSCNVGEVLTMFGATLLGMPLPLIPMQILWMNLVTDGLPAIALGVDPGDQDIMLRRPRSTKEGIFAQGLHWKIVVRGVLFALCALIVFSLSLHWKEGDLDKARTIAFSTLVMAQLLYVFQCRSERYSVFELGLFSNPQLALAVLFSTAMQVAAVHVGQLQPVFRTVPLDLNDWLMVFVFSSWSVILEGLLRSMRRQTLKRFAPVKG